MATVVKSKVSRTKQVIIKTEMPFTKMNYKHLPEWPIFEFSNIL